MVESPHPASAIPTTTLTGSARTSCGHDYLRNPRFEKLTGYAASEVQGKNPRFLTGDDKDQKGLKEIRRALREQRDVRALVRNYRKDGTPFWNDLTLTPIRNHMGRVTQWAGVMNDVTEREQSERRLSTQVAVIRALSETTQLSEASLRILQALCEGQDWELGTLWLLDCVLKSERLRFGITRMSTSMPLRVSAVKRLTPETWGCQGSSGEGTSPYGSRTSPKKPTFPRDRLPRSSV